MVLHEVVFDVGDLVVKELGELLDALGVVVYPLDFFLQLELVLQVEEHDLLALLVVVRDLQVVVDLLVDLLTVIDVDLLSLTTQLGLLQLKQRVQRNQEVLVFLLVYHLLHLLFLLLLVLLDLLEDAVVHVLDLVGVEAQLPLLLELQGLQEVVVAGLSVLVDLDLIKPQLLVQALVGTELLVDFFDLDRQVVQLGPGFLLRQDAERQSYDVQLLLEDPLVVLQLTLEDEVQLLLELLNEILDLLLLFLELALQVLPDLLLFLLQPGLLDLELL